MGYFDAEAAATPIMRLAIDNLIVIQHREAAATRSR
jgi:hypothetical protein